MDSYPSRAAAVEASACRALIRHKRIAPGARPVMMV